MAARKKSWGNAPQESDTARGCNSWGSAPQESDTARGRSSWGGAPQESNSSAGARRSALADAPEYTFYILGGITYKVRRLISAESGEAKIFEVENDGHPYVLKLYRSGVKPNHAVLDKVMKLRGNGLLVDIYAHGTWHDDVLSDDFDYEIMQFCGGGSLASLMLKGDEKRMKEIAVRMASAIDFAHRHGILHRDVKPANFLFTDKSQGSFVLTDWGLAKTLDSRGRTVTDAGRTKIYAAPEMYTYIPGTPTYVGTKADYFSMGMALLALWMGEGLLTADERKLVLDKQEETLPYPSRKEMSEHLLSLIKALTRRNPDKRAGFDEIVRWAKGEIIFKESVRDDSLCEFKIVFSAKDNLIAHNNAELAAIMWKNGELAKKYLYSDNVAKWFRDIERPETAIEIEEITEMLYPGDRDAGLYAACLLLDPSMPYYGLKGESLVTKEEIARELLYNQDEYVKCLSSATHPLWIYLRAVGLDKEAKAFPAEIAKKERIALRKLVYQLDPTLPYRFAANGKYIDIRDLNEYAACYTGGNNTGLGFQINEDFLLWVSTRDKALAGKAVQALNDSNKSAQYNAMLVHYTLLPDRDYAGAPVKNSTFATPEHLALRMVQEIEGSVKYTKGFGICDNITRNFENSPLHAYLTAKGIYGRQISWIKYCLEFGSDDNRKKYGPYNLRIAQFKAAAGLLGGTVPLTVGKKTFRTPRDVSAIETDSLSTNSQDIVADWLAIHFQENPNADYRKRSYYQLTLDYYDHLAENLDACSYMKRVDKDSIDISAAVSLNKKAWRKVRIVRCMAALLCFLPLLAVCVLGTYLTVRFGTVEMSGILTLVGHWVGICIGGFVFLCVLGDDYSIISSAIAGILVYAVTKAAFSFLGVIVPWLVIAVMFVALIFFGKKVFFSARYHFEDGYTGFGWDEAVDRFFMGIAFNSKDKVLPGVPASYPVCVVEDSTAVAENAYPGILKSSLWMLLLTAVGLGLCFWTYRGFSLDGMTCNTEAVSMLDGHFAGHINGTPVDITFTKTADGTLDAFMDIHYRSGDTRQRMISAESGEYPISLHKEDNDRIRLDVATAFSDDGKTVANGSYTNSKGNTQQFYIRKK